MLQRLNRQGGGGSMSSSSEASPVAVPPPTAATPGPKLRKGMFSFRRQGFRSPLLLTSAVPGCFASSGSIVMCMHYKLHMPDSCAVHVLNVSRALLTQGYQQVCLARGGRTQPERHATAPGGSQDASQGCHCRCQA